MTTIQFYVLGVPLDALKNQDSQLQRNLATQGTLQGGNATRSISLQPGEQPVRGDLRGKYAGLMAAEIEGLADAPGIDAVPVFVQDEPREMNGYYSIGDAQVGPQQPQAAAVLEEFSVTLTRQGSRRSQWRATTTDPVQPEGTVSAFGNDTTGYVGVPAAAEKVRWYNPETQARSEPSVVETRSGEFGAVDVYDVQNGPGFSDPVLIYDLAYEREGEVDAKVWDDHDRSKLDSDGINSWQRVFRPSHEYAGDARIENGLLRLTFDEAGNELTAEEWDAVAEAWTALSLGTSDWELFDVDVTHVGQARVDAQVEFRDPTASPTSYYALDAVLHRGYTDVQFWIPSGQSGGCPSGLSDRLAPVADSSVVDVQDGVGLVSREEARK